MIPRRQIIGWCFFDVANSAYTTLIVTVAFNVVFSQLIVGGRDGGFAHANSVWAYVLAGSWLASALCGPVLGNLSDRWRARKKFLTLSVFVCCAATGLLYFVSPGDVWMAGLLVVFSNIAYSLSENFIAAFLPHISNSENVGRISGWGWGLGYFGGLFSIILCQALTGLDYHAENFDRLRLIGPITAAFFLLASVPTLLWLKEPARGTVSVEPFSSVFFVRGFFSLPEFRRLRLFLLSCFFFQGGLAIVISFAALYGQQVVGIEGGWQAAFFLSLQITAAAGAFFFGFLQSRWGGLRTLNLTLWIWLVAIAGLYFLRDACAGAGVGMKIPFLVVGNLAGLCLGATQSCARALVAQYSPASRSGESFGLWGFYGKLASVFALVSFGWIQTQVALHTSILFCAVLFAVGLELNRRVAQI